MQDFVQTDYPMLLWLTQREYDSLGEYESRGIYFIKDANRIYRGSKKLLDNFAVVDSFPEPYDGDLHTHTLCIREGQDGERVLLEARLLNDDLTWTTLLPPVLSEVDEDEPTDGLLTEHAVVVFVSDKLAALKAYVDDLYEQMQEALQAAVAAQADAEAAAAQATAAAEMAVDNGELSRSYAKGATGVRPGEDKDNAQYFCNEARKAFSTMTAVRTISSAEAHVVLQEGVTTHAPEYSSDYTLPAVEDTAVLHRCVLEVLFTTSSIDCTIKNSSGDTLAPLTSPTIANGSVVRYTCTFSNLLSDWVVEATLLNP